MMSSAAVSTPKDEETKLERGLCPAFQSNPGTGYTVIDGEGRIVEFNDRAAHIYFGAGVSAESLIGRKLADLFPAEWVRERVELFHRVLATRTPVLFRSIYGGVQVLTWLFPASDDVGPSGSVVAVHHEVAGTDPLRSLGLGTVAVVEGEIVDLGPLNALTPREIEVLALLGEGNSMKEISSELGCSLKTAEKHRGALGVKLGLDDRVKLARLATFAGLTRRDARRQRVIGPRAKRSVVNSSRPMGNPSEN